MQTFHRKMLTRLSVILLISIMATGIVIANENEPVINADLIQIDINQIDNYQVPPTIGGYTILPGGILDGTPDDLAPAPGACDTAAGSYVSEGLKAMRTTMISFDNIVYDNKDPELVLYALYAVEANAFMGVDALFNSPSDMDEVQPFVDNDIVTIGAETTCVSDGAMTARLWQLNNGLWAVDSIQFNEPLDISASWENAEQSPNPQLGNIQFDMPVLVEGIVIRYMLPYIEPPVTTVPNADEIATVPTPACDNTAPSYLSVGTEVMLNGYGYAQFPTNINDHWTDWTFDDMQVELGDYGYSVYLDILQNTPLLGIVGNFDSVMLEPTDLYSGINFGTVVDGPHCTSMNVEPATEGDVTEAPDPDHDRFYTWWMIEINGKVGWYPEVIGQYSHWLWDQEGMFNRKLVMYTLIPASAMQTQANNCPSSNLYAGLEVAPSFNNLNLRAEPNGEVIGRLGLEQTAMIFGEPICEGGTNWWQTDRGYVAETDPETRVALLLPAVQKAREAAAVEETVEETVIITPVPQQPEPQTTPEPEQDDEKDKKKKNKSSDVSGAGFTVETSSSSSCDPATGRGC